MLENLSVKNFILIDDLNIEFEKGLCVITGETGAGKSILLDAILFCLGYKLSGNLIKAQKDYCSVSAIFSLNNDIREFLNQIHIEYDSELLIKTVQKAGNRKSFFINDQAVSQITLQKLADYLFELHGQNNHTLLLAPSSHLNILDNYADLLPLVLQIKERFTNLQNIIKEINEIKTKKDEIDQQIDYLTFVTEELTKLNIHENEEQTLADIRHDLQNRDKKIQLINDILEQVNNPNIDQAIGKAERLIARNLEADVKLESIADNLEKASIKLEEARSVLQNIINNFEANEYDIEEVEDRLFAIRGLSRKYNIPSTEMNNFLSASKKQLHELQEKVNNVNILDEQLSLEQKKYLEIAAILSKNRLEAARNLEDSIQQELKQLKMEKAVFKIEITSQNTPSHLGLDNVIFTASTNPGTPSAPIHKIASGGELSRFMLAFKTSLFDKLSKPTLIFDEIDTGIGGKVADKVGERLKKLSTIAQVIVITHQPQVAGKAAQHIMISKLQRDNSTEVSIKNLTLEERYHEIARMISGKIITETSLKAAKELIN